MHQTQFLMPECFTFRTPKLHNSMHKLNKTIEKSVIFAKIQSPVGVPPRLTTINHGYNHILWSQYTMESHPLLGEVGKSIHHKNNKGFLVSICYLLWPLWLWIYCKHNISWNASSVEKLLLDKQPDYVHHQHELTSYLVLQKYVYSRPACRQNALH